MLDKHVEYKQQFNKLECPSTHVVCNQLLSMCRVRSHQRGHHDYIVLNIAEILLAGHYHDYIVLNKAEILLAGHYHDYIVLNIAEILLAGHYHDYIVLNKAEILLAGR